MYIPPAPIMFLICFLYCDVMSWPGNYNRCHVPVWRTISRRGSSAATVYRLGELMAGASMHLPQWSSQSWQGNKSSWIDPGENKMLLPAVHVKISAVSDVFPSLSSTRARRKITITACIMHAYLDLLLVILGIMLAVACTIAISL